MILYLCASVWNKKKCLNKLIHTHLIQEDNPKDILKGEILNTEIMKQ